MLFSSGVNDDGVFYGDMSKKSGLQIYSPDIAVVNVLTNEDFVSEIPLPLNKISSVTGMAFNLYNNVWETNYIFWYPYRKEDVNQKFRFTYAFY